MLCVESDCDCDRGGRTRTNCVGCPLQNATAKVAAAAAAAANVTATFTA